MDPAKAAAFLEGLSRDDIASEKDIVQAMRAIMNVPDYAHIILRNREWLPQHGGDKILESAFRSAAVGPESSVVLAYIDSLKNKPYKNAVLEAAFKHTVNGTEAGLALYHIDAIKGQPYYDEVLKTGLVSCIKHGNADNAIYKSELLDGKPYKEAYLKFIFEATAKSPNASAAFIFHDNIKGRPYYDKVIESAFKTAAKSADSEDVLSSASLMQGKSYYDAVLKTAFVSTMNGKDSHEIIRRYQPLLLKQPYGAALQEKAYRKNAADDSWVVLQNLAPLKGKLYSEDVTKIAFEHGIHSIDAAEFSQYATLLHSKPYGPALISKYFDDGDHALKFATQINQNHEQPDTKRFADLKCLQVADIFNVITHGRPEVYTSTYNGLMDSLLQKLKKTDTPLTSVLSTSNMERMDVFLEVAASYNRLGDALSVIPKDKMPSIISTMVQRVGTSTDLNYSQTLVTMMLAVKDQPGVRHQLETEVKVQFERAKHPAVKDKFGFIASAYGANCNSISPDMKSFYVGISHHRDYALPKMEELGRASLVDRKGVCNQLMVFSYDEDSKRSYQHFVDTYKGKQNWKTIDHKEYIEITNTSGTTPIRILANKPEFSTTALETINQDIAKSQGQSSPSFQMFIGRGHSYHAKDYLPLINPEMKLVHLGSCGGFQNLSEVYKTSPSAQVISTQKTGSMYVNDPLLFSINDSISRTGGVSWREQQGKLNKVGSKNKDAYILPHKNIPAMMQRAYLSVDERRAQLVMAKQLDASIKDRSTFSLLQSDGVIDQEELNDILLQAKKAGKKIQVVQNKGDADQIILTDDKFKVTYKVKLGDDIKSQTRTR